MSAAHLIKNLKALGSISSLSISPGVLSKFTDDEDRPTLTGYGSVPRVYPASSRDKDCDGLWLLTSNGSLRSG